MIRCALIGYGYWGKYLLRALTENRACKVIACSDKNPKALQQIQSRYPSILALQDPQEIMRNKDIDAVVIATPVNTHYGLAMAALRHGKHAFVEKPLTQSMGETQRLIRMAEAKGRTLMVGHTFEYNPAILKIRQIIRSGMLGKIHYITLSRINLGIHRGDSDVLWDLCPHDFSILFSILDDKPAFVSAVARACVRAGQPDVAFVNVRFASGVIANIHVSWLSPVKLRRMLIVGDERMLLYDDLDPHEKIKIYGSGVRLQESPTFGEYQLSYRTGSMYSPHLPSKEPLQIELTHFFQSIARKRPPRTDGYSALRIIQMITAAQRSLRYGGRQERVGV